MTTKDKDRFEKKIARMRADQERLKNEIALLRKENRETAKALNQTRGASAFFACGFHRYRERKDCGSERVSFWASSGIRTMTCWRTLFADFVHPRLKNVTRDFQRRRASGKWAPEEYETDLVAKNGEVLSCDVRVRKVRRRGRTAFLLMLIPSADRKKREKDLVESKKRESLCRMAREITRRVDPYLEQNSTPAEIARNGKEGNLRWP